jgi:pyruvate dehydrogenase E2 component (dihydrolipoamide acetyltransferase)
MDVLMPQLGETVAEGKITKWFKSAGEAVKPGDNLFEVETDKVAMEVPSTTAGLLAEIRVPAGAVVPVGAVVAVISDGTGAATSPGAAETGAAATAISSSSKPQEALAGAVQQSSAHSSAALTPASIKLDPFFEVRTPARNYGPARLASGTFVTPLARRLAAQGGIDLGAITPSGPHGRIVARDVQAARTIGKPAAPGALPFAGPTADQVKTIYRDTPFEEVPLDGMRRTIAERLTQAKQTIPHFYLTVDIEIGRLLELREQANAATPADRAPALKLSINDLIVKAWAMALQRVPAANAVWAGDRILQFKHSDIGVAVAIDGGLIAPVIRRAEAKTLSAIARELKDLAARARAKKLTPDEYQGGSSAISNLGMYGVREFSAIINPPQATILAVGAACRQPIEKPDGGVAFVSLISVTLSCDHRVVDGALGAELLSVFKGFLEQPVTMLV